MAVITFGGETYTVDHAVKGADYVHGYDANGICVVSFEAVEDMSLISYDGTFLTPESCAAEKCNKVVFCGGKLQTLGGDSLGEMLSATLPITGWELADNGAYSVRVNVAGVLASDHPIMDVDITDESAGEIETILEAWGTHFMTRTFDGYIVSYFSEIPAVNIPVKLRIVRG